MISGTINREPPKILTKEKLLSILPDVKNTKLDLAVLVEQLNVALSSLTDETNFANHKRQAAFIAQCGHESGNFCAVAENLNYGAQGLAGTWPKRFAEKDAQGNVIKPVKPNALANQIQRKPELIANNVYADRMGNGPVASGEGWKFRGRGFIQLTGKENYTKCGKAIGVDLIANPDYLTTVEGAMKSALWFWNANGLNSFADKDDIVGMTKRINGGTIGLEERKAHYEKALKILSEGK